MGALKDIYSPSFLNSFADAVEVVLPSFDRKKFTKAIFNTEWKDKELMQRMKHITSVLHQFLPTDFDKSAGVIKKSNSSAITEVSKWFKP